MPTSHTSSRLSRREVLQQAAALIAGAAVNAGRLQAQQPEAQITRFFPGFKSFKADGVGAVINGVFGGKGPPILLLHGAGQTHVVWHSVAPQLAANYTVVATDLRGDPGNIHAMCEDYRAAASIDLEHDEADLGKKIPCPLLVLLGEKSPLCKPYDMRAIWRERATNVTVKSLPGGHELQVDVPDLFLAEVRSFLNG